MCFYGYNYNQSNTFEIPNALGTALRCNFLKLLLKDVSGAYLFFRILSSQKFE